LANFELLKLSLWSIKTSLLSMINTKMNWENENRNKEMPKMMKANILMNGMNSSDLYLFSISQDCFIVNMAIFILFLKKNQNTNDPIVANTENIKM